MKEILGISIIDLTSKRDETLHQEAARGGGSLLIRRSSKAVRGWIGVDEIVRFVIVDSQDFAKNISADQLQELRLDYIGLLVCEVRSRLGSEQLASESIAILNNYFDAFYIRSCRNDKDADILQTITNVLTKRCLVGIDWADIRTFLSAAEQIEIVKCRGSGADRLVRVKNSILEQLTQIDSIKRTLLIVSARSFTSDEISLFGEILAIGDSIRVYTCCVDQNLAEGEVDLLFYYSKSIKKSDLDEMQFEIPVFVRDLSEIPLFLDGAKSRG